MRGECAIYGEKVLKIREIKWVLSTHRGSMKPKAVLKCIVHKLRVAGLLNVREIQGAIESEGRRDKKPQMWV
jgi:hypothetical protein